MNSANFRRSLVAGVAGFALGIAAGGTLLAQEGPKEARPQLMAPDPGFIQQLSFADLVEEVSPAVVSIRTEADVPVSARMGIPPELERMLPPSFREFMPEMEEEEGETTRRSLGQGSGFFINDRGHIVTNNHVIDGADEITVVLNNGDELTAELVGMDPWSDLAVLKVDPSPDQRYVQFSEESDLRVGDYVLAVGNPFGLGGSVTSGIVSAMDRDGGARNPYSGFIQIDASINRGNSGGPTFDLRGNVVGVNTAIISPTGGNVGIGLAVPAELAADVVRQIIDNGAVTRGWLGVGIGDVDDRLAAAVGLDSPVGAIVQSVQPDSPAEKAGFEEGDVVLEFGGKSIDSATGLTRVVGGFEPGKSYKAKVIRGGRERTLTVTLDRRDPTEARAAGGADEGERENSSAAPTETELGLGLTLSSLTTSLRERYGFDEDTTGVLIAKVDRNSESAEAGFREGMVVSRADNETITQPEDLVKAVKAAKQRGKEALLVRVQTPRQGAFFLAMPVEGQS
ncbi:Do family serine endopeptidase [Parvularcula bermudensis]|nr:Do family serine endopeptidase [Parvularcula bermudensis]